MPDGAVGVILAVDPGLACGWAVVQRKPVRVIDFGVLTPQHVATIDRGTDRARRVTRIGDTLEATARGHGCTMIAAESALAFGTVHAVIPQAMVWGSLTKLAGTLDIDLAEVKAKEWQHAVLPGRAGRKMDYAALTKELGAFIGGRITKIDPDLRTHALDAIGIGMYTALSPVVLIHRGRARRERDHQRNELHVEREQEGATHG